MLIAQHFAVAEAAGVINAGMVFAVAEHIVVPPDQSGDDAEVRLKARREGHDGLFAQKLCQGALKLQMQLQGAV